MSINTVSFSVVSLMAMVPDRECSTPTLMVSAACARVAAAARATPTAVGNAFASGLRMFDIFIRFFLSLETANIQFV